jgi:DNA repair protein RecO (recombination protein O)
MSLYRDEAIVIRTYKLGEADRIVVLFTREHGKVRAVAKGVRKTTSRFGGRLEPTRHIALQLYEGRELDTVTQVESLDTFSAIRDDLDRIGHALAMLEAVEQITQDREPNRRVFELLVGALRTLDAQPHPLVVPAFFWKLLAAEGFRPMVEACVMCGEEDGLCAFDAEEGGLLCREHRRGNSLRPESVRLLQLILGGQLNVALAEPPSPACTEVEMLATTAIEHHLERRLRSLHVLDL